MQPCLLQCESCDQTSHTYGNDSSTRVTRPAAHMSLTSPNDIIRDEAQGDVLVHSFWQCARGTVFDVCICNTDSRFYANTSSDKVLELASKEKVQKYKPACITQHQDFTRLVYSVDGLSSKEAQKAKRRCNVPMKKVIPDHNMNITIPNYSIVWLVPFTRCGIECA